MATRKNILNFLKRAYRHQLIIIASFSMLFTNILLAQKQPDRGQTYVDNKGVIRWKKDKEEVHGFGVNYTVPFAHAFRSAKRLGVDPKKAIDQDVYHFTRLGFDLYRVHVWDTEISDSLGNLLQNEHLDTFDYLVKQLKDKGLNYVLTPIAFWGNGWPEPDQDTPGFSHKYGKGNSLTNPDAIKAGANYLAQFLNHVNPYTGLAYKNDPSVIAFEVSNEPHHGGEAQKVTEYVETMVKAMKSTGTKKPIFYNISHGIQYEEAYFKADIDGGTFQWYPTGLTYQKELSGNLLPNANDYNIPFDDVIKKNKGAKIVYEFDAADVGKSYMYPALARSFREAGIQIATQFAYDPTYLAYANTEYNTHYMNLSYTPQKALSLMIAGEVFHEVPMNADFGSYPENTRFGDFEVSYEKDLALYNADDKFIYTNETSQAPKNEQNLNLIAGYSNSPVVSYDGQGAYFLDKIADGVWRLEVMPDAVWVDNPFGKNSPRKTVAVIQWAEHQMKINLNDLSGNFNLEAINQGNRFTSTVSSGSFSVKPGTYMLTKSGISKSWSVTDSFKAGQLKDFYAPESTAEKAWFKHTPLKEVTAGEPVKIEVQYVAPNPAQKLQIMTSGFRGGPIEMNQVDNYHYEAVIPAERVNEGTLNYTILVTDTQGNATTYPSGMSGRSFDWDFYDLSSYQTRVIASEKPILLYNTNEDSGNLLLSRWSRGFKVVPLDNPWESEYEMNMGKIASKNGPNDYTVKHFILDRISGRKDDLSHKSNIVLKGRSLSNKPTKVQIAFVLDNGAAYGAILELQPELKEYSVSLESLKIVKNVTMPRPYPDFLPYYLEHDINSKFDINRIESLQISVGPGLSSSELESEQGIGLVSVWLR